MSPTMYFLIDEIFASRAPGYFGADFWSFTIAMWVISQNLVTPPTTEGGISGKKPFYQYINNVSVLSSPAWRPAWRQHITVTALIVPRSNNVKKKVDSNCGTHAWHIE